MEDESPTLSHVKLVMRFVKQLGQPTQLVQHLHGDMTGNVLMAVKVNFEQVLQEDQQVMKVISDHQVSSCSFRQVFLAKY